MSLLPELLTVEELGARVFPAWDTRRRRRWIYRAIEERGLPVTRFGRQVLINTSDAAEFFARHSTHGVNGNEKGAPNADAPLAA